MHPLSAALVFLAAGPVIAAVATEQEPTVTVYQLSGAVHCLPDRGMPPERAADLLRAQGVKVTAVGRRMLPLETGGACGAPTGEANVLKVAAADWTAFTTQNPDAAGYGLWIFDSEQVEVYRYDGTLQCGMGQEIPLGKMAQELGDAGIEVSASRKGSDALAHIAVCGASTGAINVYTIPRQSLPAAQATGFKMLVTREMTGQIKPGIDRAPSLQTRPAPRAQDRTPEPVLLLW